MNNPTHDPIASIREHVEQLSVSHAWWASRSLDRLDGGVPGGVLLDRRDAGKARGAANDAVDAIDAALRELHDIRSQIITETRQWDDAVSAEVDAFLARLR